MKKIISLALALIMILSLATTAFAADTGSITITNATENVEYSIYKVFDLTYSETDPTKVSYTYTKTGDSDALYTALAGAGSPFTLTPSVDANVYNVSTTADSAAIAAWLKNNANLLTKTATQVATGATVMFNNVDFGYYYVTSTLGTVVTINSAKPNVEVKDKNEKPTIDKVIEVDGTSVDKTNVNIGDTVDFKVNITVRTGAKNYVLHDTMSKGLTFTPDSIVVKNGDATVDASNYTVTDTGMVDGCTFEVVFNNDYLAGLADKTVISVCYSATLNDDAVIASTGNINTAKLTYGDPVNVDTNGDGIPDTLKTPETAEDKATVYTYAIALKKVNQKGEALKDATFQFPFYVNETPDANGAYSYAGTTAGAGLTNTITTPASGEIVVKGLKVATYNITETEAPAGYNKLTTAVPVSAAENNDTTTNYTGYLDADGNVVNTATETEVTYQNNNLAATVVVVVNKTGSVLPDTGGMGTTLFYILGGLLTVGALVLLVTKKRMNAA